MSVKCNSSYDGGMICRMDYPGISACTSHGGTHVCLMVCPHEFEPGTDSCTACGVSRVDWCKRIGGVGCPLGLP